MVALARSGWLVLLAVMLITSTFWPRAALADWSAEISRELGRLKVTVWGDVEDGRAVYATCDTARNALLAFIVPSTDPMLSAAGMTLSFAFPGGARWTSPTSLYRYDNDFVAVGYANANDVPAIVNALASARDNVRIGLTAAGSPARTWSADVRGSSAAARKFLDNCFATN
jgi:hypothetical protein